MNRGVGTQRRGGEPSIAAIVRRRIERAGERFWRVSDFPRESPTAVARTLARLAEEGVLERPRRGLYYRPKETGFGMSKPSATAIAAESMRVPVQPAGLSAANVLGLSTQNPAISELVTSANNPPPALQRSRVRTRRPESRMKLSAREGALLEVLRDRGRSSDMGFKQTHRRLRYLLRDEETFRRLARAARGEPPRVRAMLGALGQELGMDQKLVGELKRSLNPLSRYDFGALRELRHAQAWQAK